MLRYGIGASGPMDRAGFAEAGNLAGNGYGAIEFTAAGLEITVTAGSPAVGFAGGAFRVSVNGKAKIWPGAAKLRTGDVLAITPGPSGNYGYLRFDGDVVATPMMGSIATSSRAGIGGLGGQSLRAGDVINLNAKKPQGSAHTTANSSAEVGPIRVTWGLHADLFSNDTRLRFIEGSFIVSPRLDRMGVRLDDKTGVFADAKILSLVSDAIVPGDIQILGDGTPIVLMRDHQPTGGYPRIATVISADLDRFAQLRPGAAVAFVPVTVDHAQRLLRGLRT
ncbi:hypothetical protein [Devosia sp. 2618]|uniref:5-oxoprolinase subunit C family protein n=1 Tax=Devosia sp. 2618 TaxID=3156454 RepID=UPI003399092D